MAATCFRNHLPIMTSASAKTAPNPPISKRKICQLAMSGLYAVRVRSCGASGCWLAVVVEGLELENVTGRATGTHQNGCKPPPSPGCCGSTVSLRIYLSGAVSFLRYLEACCGSSQSSPGLFRAGKLWQWTRRKSGKGNPTDFFYQ